MWFLILLSGLYPLFALGLFAVVIWPKRDDSEHVRRMADAWAGVAWPLGRRMGPEVGRRWARRTTAVGSQSQRSAGLTDSASP